MFSPLEKHERQVHGHGCQAAEVPAPELIFDLVDDRVIHMSYTLLFAHLFAPGYGQSVYPAPDASSCDARDSSWQHKACHVAATFFWGSLMVA